MAGKASLTAGDLAPGDLITMPGRGACMIVSNVRDHEEPHFIRVTMLEPWPYILATYDMFHDSEVKVSVLRDGEDITVP